MRHLPDHGPWLVGAGASVESAHPIVHLPETLVMDSIACAGKWHDKTMDEDRPDSS